jgi:glycosyltransferase involved in cell wall biosynthesis
LRVCLDARKLWDSGIGNYIRGLLEGFEHIEADPQWDLIVRSDADDRSFLRNRTVQWHQCGAPDYSLSELMSLGGIANRTGADLFHAPHYVVPFGLKLPLIITIHDVIHLRFPQYFSSLKRAYARWMLSRACRQAHAILTISEQTKRDLIEMLGAQEDKIFITYSGISQRYFQSLSETQESEFRRIRSLPEDYLLYVGNLKPHKNVSGLIVAWANLPDSVRPPLVIAGAKIDQYGELNRLVHELHGETEVFFTGNLPDEEMPALYQCALAYVQPSWYEGFGAPPLEAMASGIPVTVSNRGASPEISGHAALIFDPADTSDFATTLATLINDSDLRQTLIEKGLKHAAKYTWDRFARKTLEVYQQTE